MNGALYREKHQLHVYDEACFKTSVCFILYRHAKKYIVLISALDVFLSYSLTLSYLIPRCSIQKD